MSLLVDNDVAFRSEVLRELLDKWQFGRFLQSSIPVKWQRGCGEATSHDRDDRRERPHLTDCGNFFFCITCHPDQVSPRSLGNIQVRVETSIYDTAATYRGKRAWLCAVQGRGQTPKCMVHVMMGKGTITSVNLRNSVSVDGGIINQSEDGANSNEEDDEVGSNMPGIKSSPEVPWRGAMSISQAG